MKVGQVNIEYPTTYSSIQNRSAVKEEHTYVINVDEEPPTRSCSKVAFVALTVFTAMIAPLVLTISFSVAVNPNPIPCWQ